MDADGSEDLISFVAGVSDDPDLTLRDGGFWVWGAPWSGGYAGLAYKARIVEEDGFSNNRAFALPDVTGDGLGEVAVAGSPHGAVFSGIEGAITHADADILNQNGTPFFVVHAGYIAMRKGLVAISFSGTLLKDELDNYATTWAYDKGLRGGGIERAFVFDADKDGSNEVVLYHNGLGADFQSLLVAPSNPGFQLLDGWPHTQIEDGTLPMGAGDLDGDLLTDLFGLSFDAGGSTLWVLTGQLDSYPDSVGIRIVAHSDEFVSATSGDFNGDGTVDIAFCSNLGDERVFFGPLPLGTIDIDSADVVLRSPPVSSGVETVAADLDADGKDELIIGHPRDDTGGESAGMVIIHWGAEM